MQGKRGFFAVCLGLVLPASVILWRFWAIQPGGSPTARSDLQTPRGASPEERQRILASYAGLPLSFEPNRGQSDPSVRFLSHGSGFTLFLTRTEAILAIRNRTNAAAQRSRVTSFRIKLIRANPKPPIVGLEQLPGKSNYFLGDLASRWRSDIPHFARVRYDQVYPGVSLIYYGNQHELEHDFIIAPGADPRVIRFALSQWNGEPRHSRGISPRIGPQGDLEANLGNGQLRLRNPEAYQVIAGARREVAVRYRLEGRGEVGFEIGPHKPDQELVIDPSLSITYTTFIGGSGDDSGNSVAIDSAGNAYIGGSTAATDFPRAAPNKLGPGGGASDLFVAKVDTTKSGAASLLYLTFLGGSDDDEGGLVAVDASGSLAILGVTKSSDFPVTDARPRTSGPNDLTVSRLNPSGNALLFSTYLGGNGAEATERFGGIAVDPAGKIYVVADTTSTMGLPITTGAFHDHYGGGASDGLVAKFDPTSSNPTTPLYCSYLGINAQVGVSGVAADARGDIYIAGYTSQPAPNSFPTTNGFQTAYQGGAFDGFVMKLSPNGHATSDLAYSTLLGGSGSDQALAIAVDSSSPPNAYVTGTTQSSNFPTHGTPFQGNLKGANSAFLSVIAQSTTPGGTSLTYSTYLGGSGSDAGSGISVVSPSQVYIAGNTTSVDFPAFHNLQPCSGTADIFVTRFDPTMGGASSLVFSTFLGGSAAAQATAIAADSLGNSYVVGKTISHDFPLGGNPGDAFQLTCTSCQQSPPLADAFLVKIAAPPGTAPSLTFSACSLNSGKQPVGSHSVPPQFAALTNTGNAPLVISAMTITGANSADFSLMNSSACTTVPLPPGNNCSFEVGFTPTIVGTETAALQVTDNAPGSPQSLSLVGAGIGPIANPSPASLGFGSQIQGTTSNAQTVSLTNSGNDDLSIVSISLGGPNPTEFSFVSGNTCVSSIKLTPGSSCTIGVVFKPIGTGAFSAEIDIVDNSGNIPTAKQVIPLSGTGTPPAPVANLMPTALSFGTQAVGGSSGPQSVTLTNGGSVLLNITGVSLAGANPTEFGLVASGTTCPTGGGSLPAGASCTVAADFAPLSSGAKSAAINFVDNAPGGPQVVALSGTGATPIAELAPRSLTFGDQSVGTSSAAQTITLANSGNTGLAISNVNVTGTNSSDFAQTNNCPAGLNAGNRCAISVNFRPTAAGSRAAAVTILDNAAGSPQSVTLSGTGTAPAVALSPTSVTFPGQLIGTASPPVPVVVANSGNATLVIAKIFFDGTNPGDYTETDNCGADVNAGASCTINVTFKPTASGSRSAALRVNDNAPGGSQTSPLSGIGTDFNLGPADGGSTSATVAAGQSASYNLQLNPVGDLSGPVSLSCSGAPPEATCAASPATVMVTGGQPVRFNVNVSTTARSLLPPAALPAPLLPRRPLIILTAGLLVAALASGKCFSICRRADFRTMAPAAALLLVLTFAGCGGGGGGGGGGIRGTPPGTYALTIIGSQQGVSRTLNLTLTVQ